MKRAILLWSAVVSLSACSGGDPPADDSAPRAKPGSGAPVVLGVHPDACAFSGDVLPSAAAADGMVDLPPNHPLIRYVGRVDCRPSAPRFSYPAVSVKARFTGSAIDVKLRDSVEGGEEQGSWYEALVDGVPQQLLVNAQKEVYSIGRDLGPGEHSLEVWRRIESRGAGQGEFLGLRVRSGETLKPVLVSGRRIEVIGDSVTCGYGNLKRTSTPDEFHYTTKNTNARLTYGAVAAQLLSAEYVAVAYSGKGLWRNYQAAPGPTLPQLYLRVLPDEASPLWDVRRSPPDVVVVNLGTNDFSPSAGGADPGPSGERFRAAYVEFLKTLRGHYPGVPLVAALGPVMSDNYPVGVRALTTATGAVQAAIEVRKGAGDADVHFISFPLQSAPYGEDWHPTVETHEKMGRQLAELVQRLKGW
ncbi:MAG: hypothetical protein IPF92_28175 [Myxococcales bacterium]|nr:hypothetical protein [Myxococcales bacterium]